MRVLSGLGSLLFLYLAVIPAGLIYATLDSACAGPGCETSTVSRVVFTLLYALLLGAILATAAQLARYSASGTLEAQRRLPRSLAVTGIAVGACAFLLFAITYPAGAALALALSAAVYLLARAHRRREAGADLRSNGYHVNGTIEPRELR